jgi:hypothetical protein
MIAQLQIQVKTPHRKRSSSIDNKTISELEADKEPLTPQVRPTSSKGMLTDSNQTRATLESISKLKKSIPKLTTEKAKAFEIFKNGYPSGSWIDGQKALLKSKYTEAKALGENAQKVRNEISETNSYFAFIEKKRLDYWVFILYIESLKECIASDDSGDKEELRTALTDRVVL